MGRVREEFKEQGLEVVAINLAPQYDSLEEFRAFLESVGGDVDFVFTQDTDDGRAMQVYDIRSLGVTVIVGRDGRIVYRDEFATAYETLREAILKALG